MWYEIKIKEEMVTTILVEAKTMQEASEMAEDAYDNHEIACDELECVSFYKPKRAKKEEEE